MECTWPVSSHPYLPHVRLRMVDDSPNYFTETANRGSEVFWLSLDDPRLGRLANCPGFEPAPFFRFFIPFLPLRLTGRAVLQKATLLFVRNLLDQITRGNPQCPRQFPKRLGGGDVIGIFENPPDCVVGDV